MSLINDALKRARMAQTNVLPRPDAPQFRPIETAQQTKRSMFMPVVSVVAFALGLFLAWELLPRNRPQPVAAAAPPPAAAAKPTTPVAPAPAPASVVSSQEEAQPLPQLSTPAPQPIPAEPAQLKLQAILYHPTRPSALISGKTLFIGDMLGEFRVVAISHDTATLVGAGQTNILALAR